jgi:hypothetical protein
MEEGGVDLDNCMLEFVDWMAVDRKGKWSDWWIEFTELGQPGNLQYHQSNNRRFRFKKSRSIKCDEYFVLFRFNHPDMFRP